MNDLLEHQQAGIRWATWILVHLEYVQNLKYILKCTGNTASLLKHTFLNVLFILLPFLKEFWRELNLCIS